jgi:Acetyl-coenzyme A synthetase N-terminus/AMP-binding enzyme
MAGVTGPRGHSQQKVRWVRGIFHSRRIVGLRISSEAELRRVGSPCGELAAQVLHRQSPLPRRVSLPFARRFADESFNSVAVGSSTAMRVTLHDHFSCRAAQSLLFRLSRNLHLAPSRRLHRARFPAIPTFSRAHSHATMAQHIQDRVYAASLRDPEDFWSHQADQLHWHRKPSRALQQRTKRLPGGIEHAHWTWFPDGEISTSYNCIDRHVHDGHGDATAIVWDSPVSGNKEKYSYKQLLHEVEVLAGVLREEGVRRGDVVLIYSTSNEHNGF